MGEQPSRTQLLCGGHWLLVSAQIVKECSFRDPLAPHVYSFVPFVGDFAALKWPWSVRHQRGVTYTGEKVRVR